MNWEKGFRFALLLALLCVIDNAQALPCKKFIELTTSIEVPLTPDFIAAVRKHSIGSLRPHLNRNSISFLIDQYDLEREAGHNRPSIVKMGESIQSNFIVKTLRSIFPKARFRSYSSIVERHASKENKIFIDVRDIAERGYNQAEDRENVLPMSLLKPVNPGFSKSSRTEIRDRLDIPKNKFIVSLYGNDMFNWDGTKFLPKFEKLIEEIDSTKKIDILFISVGGAHALRYDRARPLSEISPTEFKSMTGGTRIRNDLSGILPYLHKVANISIVIGALNMFEPLNEGTPVIFFNNKDAIRDYNKEIFEKMAKIAKLSGGGIELTKFKDVKPAVQSLIRESPSYKITPPFKLDVDGTSPLKDYLDRLEEVIRQQVELP